MSINTSRVIIAPSILAADFGNLLGELRRAEEAGAQLIHIDVMDGHFVPNITVGIPVINSLKGKSSLLLDVHLMIEEPERYIESFCSAGSDILTVHIEVCPHPADTIERIHTLGAKAGMALNPQTPLKTIMPYIGVLDVVLLMTVNPGFGGQAFIPEILPKVAELRSEIKKRGLSADIEVDGGVNPQTAGKLIRAGANILVAGTAVFGAEDVRGAIETLAAMGEAKQNKR